MVGSYEGFRFSVDKSHAVLFRHTRHVFPEPSHTLYDCLLSVFHKFHLLSMSFDEHMTWVPHLKLLCLACQSPLDLLCHLTHTTWGADRTTLLHLYLVLFHSKLDYGAHVYCTASTYTLCIFDPVENEGLHLATGAFRSSLITSHHVEYNVVP